MTIPTGLGGGHEWRGPREESSPRQLRVEILVPRLGINAAWHMSSGKKRKSQSTGKWAQRGDEDGRGGRHALIGTNAIRELMHLTPVVKELPRNHEITAVAIQMSRAAGGCGGRGCNTAGISSSPLHSEYTSPRINVLSSRPNT